ncbi:MAG: DUF1232 domain-containing protein [Victivallaceae bacterium]|nr:DUF1232 domain-containing protein [Victivallaceae bacterium]
MADTWKKAKSLFEKILEGINIDKIKEIVANGGIEKLLVRLKDTSIEDVRTLLQLLKDYCNGEYKEVPWKFIVSVAGAFAYLLLPLDAIPDVIPIAGFIDDAAVFGFVLSSFKEELEKYRMWKGIESEPKALENNDNE